MALLECAPGGPEPSTAAPREPEDGFGGVALAEPAAAPGAQAPPTRGPGVSFEELYVSSYQSLVRLAFVLTGSRELAEDLVQDSFVRLHRHFDRLETPDRYARQVVVNACRSHFRRSGRERERRPLLYVVDGEGGGTSSGELHDLLLRLPYRQRAAIVLRFYADLSENEIAEALECRPGTVGSLIHRGLEHLRGAIER
ncbi:MAG TPA: sigma factor-like helix-turn-helix DNA-binding protein [Acidimicrobiales bacterium]|nr:sigma factor-like helix-turn-helix DNA-binding protein [Acidimicrobiales bacterium]